MAHETLNTQDTDSDLTALHRLRSNEDYNLELAGLDVGRQRRHLPKSAAESTAERQKKSEHHATMTALQWLLLMDAEYAASLRAFQAQLAEANLRLTQLHLEAEEIVQERSARLDAIRAKAGTLDDGTRVYRDRHGAVFTEDGALLDAELRAQVVWQDGSPSLEEYRAAKDAYDRAVDFRSEIVATQDEIDAANSRSRDQHNPLQKEEILERSEALKGQLDNLERTRDALLDDPEAAVDLVHSFNAVSPDLDLSRFQPSPVLAAEHRP